MTTYLSFLAFATLLALAPGPDTFLTLRASVVGGRRRGLFTAAGISAAGAVQGLLAAMGLGAVLAHSEPVFLTIRWAGVVYLTWLGVTALWAALRPDGSAWAVGSGRAQVHRGARPGPAVWRPASGQGHPMRGLVLSGLAPTVASCRLVVTAAEGLDPPPAP